jgi:NADH:ubiquinone oxidoreductase subunit E
VAEKPDDLRDRARGAIAAQPQGTVTVLSCLLAVQDELGYVPTEAVEEVAIRASATINDVWGVASFYTNFRVTPPTQHIVEVCWGPTCHISGAQGVLAGVHRALGMDAEGDSPDGRVTLKYNTCLGACVHAPVIEVDHRIVGRVTPETAMAHVTEATGK